MILTKVIINTNTEASDLVSNILLENGSLGTTIIDRQDIEDIKRDKRVYSDYFEDNISLFYPEHVLVVGVFDHNEHKDGLKNIQKELNSLAANCNLKCGELSMRTEKVNDEHWVDIWTDFYKPIKIGKFVIYANWQKVKKSLFKKPIILDPGAAFGTGQHPTTSMSIKLMHNIELKNKTVFDIGCGSGILGIIAIKLGASFGYLTDIDPTACENANINAKLNNVTEKVDIRVQDLVGDNSVMADVIVANITADVLIQFSKNIRKNLNKDGHIIISGIIEERSEEVLSAYTKNGFNVVEKQSNDGWVAYLLN